MNFNFSCNVNNQKVRVTPQEVTRELNQQSSESDEIYAHEEVDCPKSTIAIQELMKQLCSSEEGFASYDLKSCSVECESYKHCENIAMKSCPEGYIPFFKSKNCRWTCQKVSKLKQH